MNGMGKIGLEGALAEALAKGMVLRPSSPVDLDKKLEASIREVAASYTPDTPARLKPGRPSKVQGRHASRMKGVRLEVVFLKRLETRLHEEHLTFSGLVQQLLGEWMTRNPAASPTKPIAS